MNNFAILFPSADSRRVVVSYKRKYVYEVLVNSLFKLVREKSVVRRTGHPNMTIEWDIKHQTKQTNKSFNFRKQAYQSIINPDWDFNKMGIGGLDREFSAIFRRAFASRVFPPDVVEQLGEILTINSFPSNHGLR